MNFFWFVFISAIIGQLGILLPLINTFWTVPDIDHLLDAIDTQAASANFLIFSIALLSSTSLFIITEYNHQRESGEVIEHPIIKSGLLLLATIIGIVSTIIAYSLMQPSSDTGSTTHHLTDDQKIMHWFIYFSSIITSFLLWIVNELKISINRITIQFKDSIKKLQEDRLNKHLSSTRKRA